MRFNQITDGWLATNQHMVCDHWFILVMLHERRLGLKSPVNRLRVQHFVETEVPCRDVIKHYQCTTSFSSWLVSERCFLVVSWTFHKIPEKPSLCLQNLLSHYLVPCEIKQTSLYVYMDQQVVHHTVMIWKPFSQYPPLGRLDSPHRERVMRSLW